MSEFIWNSCQLSEDGIQYNEMYDSYSLQINREGGSTAQRRLSCAWGDAIDLAQALKGNSVEVGGELVYTDAKSHPLLPSLKVSGVNITPAGEPISAGVWEQAFLNVAYDVPEFPSGGSLPDAEDLAEESLDISAFNEQIPNEKVQFANGDAVEEDVFQTVRVIEYRKTLYRQANLPVQAIADLLNKVNASAWNGVAEGRALYGGAEASRVITDEGAEEWTITHVVYIGEKDQRVRWNATAGAFQTVEFKNGGDPIIDSGNFSTVGL